MSEDPDFLLGFYHPGTQCANKIKSFAKSIDLIKEPNTKRISLRKTPLAVTDQGPDETLSHSSSCTTKEHTKKRELNIGKSVRGKSKGQNDIQDPKLAGILCPVVSLKRLPLSYAVENLKKENRLWAPLKLLANASNGELASTLEVPWARLDTMSVSELLVLLRNDKRLTAIREKCAVLDFFDHGETASSGYASEAKSDLSIRAFRKENAHMSSNIDKEGTVVKEVRINLFRIDEQQGEGEH